MPHIRNVGEVRPPSLFICASSFKCSNGTGTKYVLNGTVRLGLSLVSSLLSAALLL